MTDEYITGRDDMRCQGCGKRMSRFTSGNIDNTLCPECVEGEKEIRNERLREIPEARELLLLRDKVLTIINSTNPTIRDMSPQVIAYRSEELARIERELDEYL